MPIVPEKSLIQPLEKEILSDLLKIFKEINNVSELDGFLDRFMTSGEKAIFIRRLAVIKLLAKNKKYRDIKNKFRISGTTISKVKDILAGRNYSQNPNRKRKYSSLSKAGFEPVHRRRRLGTYKGSSGLLDPFQILNDL